MLAHNIDPLSVNYALCRCPPAFPKIAGARSASECDALDEQPKAKYVCNYSHFLSVSLPLSNASCPLPTSFWRLVSVPPLHSPLPDHLSQFFSVGEFVWMVLRTKEFNNHLAQLTLLLLPSFLSLFLTSDNNNLLLLNPSLPTSLAPHLITVPVL